MAEKQPWQQVDEYLRRLGVRIGPARLSQTTGGKHGPTSLHPLGRARDYGDLDSDCNDVVNKLLPFARGTRPPICELIYSPRLMFYRNGQPYEPKPAIERSHRDHVHVGIADGRSLPLPPMSYLPPQQLTPPTGDDDMQQPDDIVSDYRYPNGALRQLQRDGGVLNYGCRYMGSIQKVPNDGKKNWREAGALVPRDPVDPEAGYDVYEKRGDCYQFGPGVLEQLRRRP